MKNFRLIIAALALCLVAFSCSKKEENVVVDDPAVVEDNTPAIVELTSNLTTNIISTKAALTAWNKDTLYFYAFKTGTIPDPDAADSVNILINNAKANAPASTMKGEIDILKADGSHYYYTADQTTYDFWGYYVGDAVDFPKQPTIDPGDSVYIPIKINGTQDIMLATTDKEEDAIQVTKMKPTDLYSTYSARNGVIPNLKFEHQLSRFVFRVISGNGGGDSVKIKSVSLRSLSKANLIIVGNPGLSSTTEEQEFKLKNQDGTDLTPNFPNHGTSQDGKWVFNEADKIGESIMVIPSTQHHFVMDLQQYNKTTGDTLGKPFKYEYDLTPSMVVGKTSDQSTDKFDKGYQYNVNIVVYGREKVQVTVTLSEWKEGGTITIDNDTEWGDNPTYGVKTTTGKYLFFYGSSIDATATDSVMVWNKSTNEMEHAAEGTYVFDATTDGKIEVVLKKNEQSKTKVESATVGVKADGTKDSVTYGLYFYGEIAQGNEVKVWNGSAMVYAAAGTYDLNTTQSGGPTQVVLTTDGEGKTTVSSVTPAS